MMKYQSLKKALTIKNGKVTISKKTLTANIDDFITAYYQGLPITITGAKVESIDETVVISGKSDILNVPDLPVTAAFSLDQKGNVQALFKYQLRPDSPPAKNVWKFSTSFPNLPTVLNYNSEVKSKKDGNASIVGTQQPFLDQLFLFNTYAVTTTQAGEDPDFAVPLEPGINFVSKMRPKGMLGVLEYSLGVNPTMTLYGTIRVPKPTGKKTLALQPSEWVWNRPEAPGIHLQAHMDVDFTWGKMTFNQAFFRIYSPTSSEWLQANDSFQPAHGYTGKLQIASADIEVELGANLKWGLPEALIYAKCSGITLGKLAQLVDMAGTDSLTSTLPEAIQDAVSQLETLELMYVAVQLEQVGLIPNVSAVSVTIGMPNLNWQVWDKHFVLDSIACRFDIQNPFGNLAAPASSSPSVDPSFAVTVMGTMEIEGVPIDVMAKSDDRFTLYASLGEAQTIPLKQLMKRYVPSVPAPSDLTIDSMAVTIAPGQLYAFSAAMAGQPNAWVIPVGPAGLTVSDVVMNMTYPTGGPVAGSFSGRIAFADAVSLYMRYGIPGDVMIRGNFGAIKLSQIISVLCNQPVSLPSGFDITFEQSSVLIQKQGSAYTFQLAALVKGVGYFAMEVKKTGTGSRAWGFAGGLAMLDAKPSQLPGLDFLKVFESVVDLQDFTLILATYDGVNFIFPNMANFANPALTSANVPMPAQAGGLIAGINVYARWRLNTKKKELKLLKSILGLDPTVGVTLQIGKNPAQDTRMFVKYDTQLAGQYPLQCQFGFLLKNGSPELFLAGTAQVKIQKKLCRFDVAMSLVKGGFYFSGSMQGTVKIGGLQLSNLALALGFNWAAIPSFGIAATIDVEGFQSSMALMLDSTDPSKCLLAGAISDLSLRDIAVTLASAKAIPDELEGILDDIELTGTRPFTMPASLIADLDNQDLSKVAKAFSTYGKVTIPSTESSVLFVVGKAGKAWNVTDLTNNMRHYQITKVKNKLRVSQNAQIYLSPNGAQLGAMVFPQGYFMTGTLSVLGMKWTSQIEVKQSKGIAAESSLNKSLVVYKPQFFQLSDSEGKQGPTFSVATFAQPNLPQKEFRQPHLYLNGRLSIVGLTSESYVKATTSGFAFDISQSRTLSIPGKVLSGKVEMDIAIHGAFDSLRNFNAGGDVSLSLSGKIDLSQLSVLGKAVSDLGKVKVDIAVSGSLDMGYNGKKAYVIFAGGFKFQNIEHNFSIALKATNADMTKAGEMVVDELKGIFKDILNTAEEWVDAVKDGLVEIEQGANQIAKVLKNGYGKTAEEAVGLVRDAGREFNEIGRAFKSVYGSSAKDIGRLMKSAGAEANEIAGTLKQTYRASAKTMAQVLDGLEESPEAIASAMNGVYKQSAKQAAQTLKSLGKDASSIARGLQKSYRQSAKQAAQVLSEVGIDAGEVGKALKGAYRQTAKMAAKTLKSLGKDSQQIAKAMQKGFNQTANQSAKLMKDVGINTHDISKAMRGVYRQSAKDVTKTLKSIGKNGREIGSALSSIYRVSAGNTAKLLSASGIHLNDVSYVMKNVYKLDAQSAAKALKQAGKTGKQIASAMKSGYRLSSRQMSKALSGAGVAIDDIGGVLKDVYGHSAKDAAKVLKDAGKSSKDVARVMKGTFKLGGKDAGNILKDTFKLGKNDLKSVMKGVGYASKEVDKFVGSAFKSAGKALKKLFS